MHNSHSAGIIAWHIRKLRRHNNLTQENLAVDAEVDRTVISDLERGKHNTSVDLLDRLGAALKRLQARPPHAGYDGERYKR
ncbi:helix-turn-helix transcriptional regulator [Rhizobium calliandrae]|uniref:helix-turn-helix transcriptional regulator n=1 Tax=Rhizobium calliandrae TaxID=1312182 RepID=UPI003D80AF36